ncbi:glycosyltransferase family 39 protein [Gimesia sp.]|uniref:glycosyltransferase family 39 protein n=1 Tax=Gimesia sp. TaxID=2024833 RepID=UPI000C6B5D49|nr:glycosyltransferase family 39 protein [Gimesia sp.]MAX38230.1 hypothetical protein [Gimesia sp.]HAH47920.1 hypothetical protein [Planctomycetaceae bacterium]|tara:strand:- start:4004 stop:5611 length:1608 start_codon:yes stop_codon:yes gene_type:complete
MITLDAPQQETASSRSYAALWWLIPITIIAIVLRIQYLSEVGYLFDESFSLKMAEFPSGEMLERIPDDISPPLFYLTLKAWMGLFGSSIYSTRMLSVVFGTIAVACVYLFVYEAYRNQKDDNGKRQAIFAAVTSALLMALCPLHISWAQRIRMYSMGTALTALSSWLLFRALNKHQTHTRDWACLTVTAILLVYTHYFGIFTLAVEYVFACGYLFLNSTEKNVSARLANLKPLLISAACVWFMWSPWIPQFLYQRSHVNQAFWSSPLTWDRFGSQLFLLFDLNLWFSNSASTGLIAAEVCFVLLAILIMGRRPADIYIAMAASLPIFTAAFISKLSRSVFAHRYLQFSQIFMLIAIAVLLSRLPIKPLRLGITVLVISGMGFFAWRHTEIRERYAILPGMQAAIARFEKTRGPKEILICCNPMLYTSADAYATNRNSIFVSGSADRYPYYQGTAVIRDGEYFSATQSLDDSVQAVWTLDAQRWFNHSWSVDMPAGWNKTGEMKFPEFYADLILRLYVRDDKPEKENKVINTKVSD